MTFWTWLGFRWCARMHPRIMRPNRGFYTCATCLRKWPVRWVLEEPARESEWKQEALEMIKERIR